MCLPWQRARRRRCTVASSLVISRETALWLCMQSMSHQVGEPHLGQNQLETVLNFFTSCDRIFHSNCQKHWVTSVNATSCGVLPQCDSLAYLMGFYCEFLFRSLVRINRWREIILFPVANQVQLRAEIVEGCLMGCERKIQGFPASSG